MFTTKSALVLCSTVLCFARCGGQGDTLSDEPEGMTFTELAKADCNWHLDCLWNHTGYVYTLEDQKECEAERISKYETATVSGTSECRDALEKWLLCNSGVSCDGVQEGSPIEDPSCGEQKMEMEWKCPDWENERTQVDVEPGVIGCTPLCSGKMCGPDGCGGTCGTCGQYQVCSVNGVCEQISNCGGVDYKGKCVGNTLHYCSNGVLVSIDCVKCGLDINTGLYDCIGCNQFVQCFNSDVSTINWDDKCCQVSIAILATDSTCQMQYPCGKGEADSFFSSEVCKNHAEWKLCCAKEQAARGMGGSGTSRMALKNLTFCD